MSRSSLVFNSLFMLVLATCSFLFGFAQAGFDVSASEDGLLVGIVSATTWGMGSMGAAPSFSNGANIVAAMLAAMSLGFLAPAGDVCKNARMLTHAACALRSTH